jgi:riboflavin biosynthesis pyrimidine reductase
MTLRRVLPVAGGDLDTDGYDARATLVDWYTPNDEEHLRLNLVSTLDGRVAGGDGTSESLTSQIDRMILGVIREHADVVLVGGETARREGYRRPRRATLAIVTASGDITGHRLCEQRASTALDSASELPPILILTTKAGAARAAASVEGATVIALPTEITGRIAVASLVHTLRARGYRGIAAEWGPSLARQLLLAHLVDEVCLTVMPMLGGPAVPMFGHEAMPLSVTTAQQLLVDDHGVQFGRWAVQR